MTADQLARAAVKNLADIHQPFTHRTINGITICRRCFTTWPCETVRIISAAEEAISEDEAR